MIDTCTEVTYNRPKAEKVVSRIPSKFKRHIFDSDDLLLRDYIDVFAVDTSTASMDGTAFSTTATVNVKSVFTADRSGIARRIRNAFSFGVPFCFVYRRPEGNPETFGWCFLIEELLCSNAYRKCPSIGMVVDSELSCTKDINARRVAIRGQLTLPANMSLNYATDTTADAAVNQLIRVADSAATQMRNEVLAGRIPVPLSEVTGPPFKGHVKLIGLNSTVL